MKPQPAPATHGHNFRKVEGAWTCSCGEKRDKHGKQLKPRHLQVVK